MNKLLLAVLTLSLLMFTNQAFATPVVDGAVVGTEWSSLLLLVNQSDPDESTIPQAYDMSNIFLYQETAGGGAGNGLYVLLELYGIPTFTSLDELPPIDPVFYSIGFDLNTDGDFVDVIDRVLDYRIGGLIVHPGTGGPIAGATQAAKASVVEFFIPASMYTAGDFNGFALLDNGGAPPDDRFPDVTYFTNVPEPSSMLLLGTGLIGLLGAVRRKFAA